MRLVTTLILDQSMSKTFCPLPFNHLYINPDGGHKPCCRFNDGYIDNNKLKDYDTLDDTLRSSVRLQAIRKSMLAGEKVSGCASCYKEEHSSGSSMRTGEINTWGDYDDYVGKDPVVTNLEITFGNYCNLACRTCGSGLSTSWIKDENILSKHYHDRGMAEQRHNVNKQWKPEEFLNVVKLKITGGEPMLHPDFLSFLDMIIASGVSDKMTVEIFTNSSFVPKSHLLERLNKFKRIGIWLSIDGTHDVQEYIRHNSKWDTVEQSAIRWLQYENDNPDNVQINFAPTISVYNIFNLKEMVTWFLELREKFSNKPEHFTNCSWNVTTFPSNIDIKNLLVKDELISELTEFKETIADINLKSYKFLIEKVIDRLSVSPQGSVREMVAFTQFNKDLDKLRKQDFITTFPELYSQVQKIWDNVDGKL